MYEATWVKCLAQGMEREGLEPPTFRGLDNLLNLHSFHFKHICWVQWMNKFHIVNLQIWRLLKLVNRSEMFTLALQ